MPTRALFDAVAGTPANAADVDKLAKGWCGLVEDTGTIGPTSATTELTTHTLSTPVLANRKLRVTFHAPRCLVTVNNDEFLVRLYYDGATFGRYLVNRADQATDDGLSFVGTINTTTAGNRTIAATAQRANGTGTFSIVGAAGLPSFLLVEDIGPSS